MTPRLDLSGGATPKVDPVSTAFLKALIDLAHQLDPTRPATLVAVMGAPMEWLALADVVSLNRYWGWYVQPGDLEAARAMLEKELDAVHAALGKPIVITEFGPTPCPGSTAPTS